MPVPKLKNLVIGLLLLVNILLLMQVIPLRMEQRQQHQRSMEQMQALFAEYALTLEHEELPQALPLYTLELSPGEGSALVAAKALLGDTVLVEDDSTRYLRLYRSEKGRCQTSRSGTFEAALQGRAPVTDPVADTHLLLQQMGLEVAGVGSPRRLDAGHYGVTATQQLLSVPVFSSQLTFLYESGALTAIEGAALFDTSTLARVDDMACISAADALVAFLGSRDALGWVGSTVTDVEQGYLRAETASAAVVRLVPGWRISTDTGAFWVNGINREVSGAM